MSEVHDVAVACRVQWSENSSICFPISERKYTGEGAEGGKGPETAASETSSEAIIDVQLPFLKLEIIRIHCLSNSPQFYPAVVRSLILNCIARPGQHLGRILRLLSSNSE